MKRRTILLTALGLVVVAVLVVWISQLRSAREPEKALTVRFTGYTNDSQGVGAAMLVISNKTSRTITYEIYFRMSPLHELPTNSETTHKF